MRNLIISMALLSTVAMAAPAVAQYQDPYRNNGYGYNHNNGQAIDRQLDQLRQRIQRASERRMISRGEAMRLFREQDQIERLYDRYRRNGLTQGETQDIRNRVQNLRQRIRYERQDDRYDNRYDDRDHDRYDRDYQRDRDDD